MGAAMMKAGHTAVSTAEVELEETGLTPAPGGRVRTESDAEDTGLISTSGAATQDLVPVWTVWKGNNKFLCDGRVITGPERGPFMGTVGMVGVPMILFFGFIIPPLLDSVPGAWWVPLQGLFGF